MVPPQLPEMETREGNILPDVLRILNYICGATTIDRQTLAADVMGLAAVYQKNLNHHQQQIASLKKELQDLREEMKTGIERSSHDEAKVPSVQEDLSTEVQASSDEAQLEDFDIPETVNSCISEEDEIIWPLLSSIPSRFHNDQLVDETSLSDQTKKDQASEEEIFLSGEKTMNPETHLEDLDIPESVNSKETVECNACSSDECEFIWPLFTNFPAWYNNKDQSANEEGSTEVAKEDQTSAHDVLEVESVNSSPQKKEEEAPSTTSDCSSPPKENNSTDRKPGKKMFTRREQKKAKKQKKRKASQW